MAITEDTIIKKAHLKEQYTQEQLEELFKCMHPETGPTYFIENYVYVQHIKRGKVKLVLYPYQHGLIDSYHNFRYSISMVSRQMGKSTVAAAYLLWYAMFKEDATILIASNKHEGAMEIMHRLRYAYENVPDFLRAGVISYNKKSIEFDNGSRIISQATTENTGRGLSLSLVYLDEFAFLPPRVAKEFWTSLSPTLSTGGKCIITSTPNTDEDQFAEIWIQANQRIDDYGEEKPTGINGFRPFIASWEQHPDRDEQWAKEEELKIGNDRFRREHKCEFITFEETLIAPAKLAVLTGNDPIKKEGHVRWYKKISSNSAYVIALDPSMGTGRDYGAIQVFELPAMEQVAEWQHNRSLVEDQIRILRDIARTIEKHGVSDIYWSVENNTIGESALAIIREVGEDSIPGTMIHESRSSSGGKPRKGFTTTNRSKLEACSKFKTWVENSKMKLNSKNLISELKTFISKGSAYEAKYGSTDDLVMATLLAIRITQAVSNWDDTVASHLSASFGDNGELEDEDGDWEPPLPIAIL